MFPHFVWLSSLVEVLRRDRNIPVWYTIEVHLKPIFYYADQIKNPHNFCKINTGLGYVCFWTSAQYSNEIPEHSKTNYLSADWKANAANSKPKSLNIRSGDIFVTPGIRHFIKIVIPAQIKAK